MESQNASESTPQTEAAKPRNFFSRLGGVYSSPGSTFREIGSAPRALVPIIAVVIIGLLAGFYLSSHLDLQSMVVDRLEKLVEQGRITKEQMEQQLVFASRFAGVQIIVGAGISSVLLPLIIAAFTKLICTFIGAENRFKAIFVVTLYATMAVSIIQSALLVLIIQLKAPAEVSLANLNSVLASNLGSLLEVTLGEDALPKFLMRLAGYVDIFSIWKIALLAIGYSAVSKKLKTATAATWLTCVYVVIAVIGSIFSSAINLNL